VERLCSKLCRQRLHTWAPWQLLQTSCGEFNEGLDGNGGSSQLPLSCVKYEIFKLDNAVGCLLWTTQMEAIGFAKEAGTARATIKAYGEGRYQPEIDVTPLYANSNRS
jgi:hypothetical protein